MWRWTGYSTSVGQQATSENRIQVDEKQNGDRQQTSVTLSDSLFPGISPQIFHSQRIMSSLDKRTIQHCSKMTKKSQKASPCLHRHHLNTNRQFHSTPHCKNPSSRKPSRSHPIEHIEVPLIWTVLPITLHPTFSSTPRLSAVNTPSSVGGAQINHDKSFSYP